MAALSIDKLLKIFSKVSIALLHTYGKVWCLTSSIIRSIALAGCGDNGWTLLVITLRKECSNLVVLLAIPHHLSQRLQVRKTLIWACSDFGLYVLSLILLETQLALSYRDETPILTWECSSHFHVTTQQNTFERNVLATALSQLSPAKPTHVLTYLYHTSFPFLSLLPVSSNL